MASDSAAGSSSGYTGIEYANNGKIILRAGHQYLLKKKYKNGSEIWECSNRRRQKCTGSIVVRVSVNFLIHFVLINTKQITKS
jgi:hypothetical protein